MVTTRARPLLTLVHTPCEPGSLEHSIVHVGAATLNQSVLLADDSRPLSSTEWTEPSVVRLTDGEGHRWWLDPLTGKITAAEQCLASEATRSSRLWSGTGARAARARADIPTANIRRVTTCRRQT